MTLSLEAINWLAVVGALVANMAVGAIWYSPIGMGKAWLESTGRSTEEMEGRNGAMALVAIPAALNAVVITLLASGLGVSTPLGGAALGLLVWLGFVMPTNWIEVLFDRKSYRTAIINNGNFIITMPLMGAIIGMWG